MRMALILAAGLISLTACDRSPQNADGATAAGDPGTAAATGTGTMADTGNDNAGADIGGAGQLAEPGGATDAGDATSPKSR
ncbi:hypothetical protein LRS10_09905 [Phenylobacterium sp. J426]|uniref:hypothetical protein n=1 Tax=Phenylobacterium sp. J426 TaxID=2898439 RepID=UPI00215133F0|nr:hypothetical protein [Phenylobacterium sp. J426]MCR5874455.1 hypothetical protein [Phenylobacterium sp. J426]